MTFHVAPADFSGRYILIADEDPEVVAFIIRTLRADGHAVFHAYDGRSAIQLVYALRQCDLIISNTKVDGMPGVELIRQLRHDRPGQPIVYIANIGRSTPETEARLPPDVPIIREPFTAEELRAVVSGVLVGRELTSPGVAWDSAARKRPPRATPDPRSPQPSRE